MAEQTSGGRARPRSLGWARVTPWRGRDDVAHLVVGESGPPIPDRLDECLARLRRDGYASVVTSAVTSVDARRFVDAGFDVRERLHLLEHPLQRVPPTERDAPRLRRAWRGDRPAVLALDERAFDHFWRLDAAGLRDALEATPAVRFRVGDDGGAGPVGYAITGRAGRRGYLQRIAVRPDARRCGWGRALVVDALRWLGRYDTRRALVNTQWENHAAVALYESCGFRRLPVGLCVLDRAL
jgi:ribosomal protein S18 acetylase RimI-like enzyme